MKSDNINASLVVLSSELAVGLGSNPKKPTGQAAGTPAKFNNRFKEQRGRRGPHRDSRSAWRPALVIFEAEPNRIRRRPAHLELGSPRRVGDWARYRPCGKPPPGKAIFCDPDHIFRFLAPPHHLSGTPGSWTLDAVLRERRQEAANIDPHEISLRQERLENGRVFKAGLLIFSVAFCALVFWAGWKEAATYKQCGLRGALTAGQSCSARPAQTDDLLLKSARTSP
jgi:hypothetical protein